MTTQEINKQFAGLAGICWHEKRMMSPFVVGGETLAHCICGDCHKLASWPINLDFCTDPRLVLEVMMKREDWLGFIHELDVSPGTLVRDYILDTTGLLALKGIEWMERKTL